MLNMQTSFTLEALEDGTRMLWSADVKIAGPVGAMGQRVLQPIVKQQVNQVLARARQAGDGARGRRAAGGRADGRRRPSRRRVGRVAHRSGSG